MASFYDAAVADDLVDEHVHLVEVEHNVQLANSTKVAIHRLHHEMNNLRDGQLVLVVVDAHDEVKGSVAPVNNLVKLVFDEVAL